MSIDKTRTAFCGEDDLTETEVNRFLQAMECAATISEVALSSMVSGAQYLDGGFEPLSDGEDWSEYRIQNKKSSESA